MILINYAVLRYRLQLSPLKSLRRDFPEKTETRHVLSPKIGIFSRFRLRVTFQNVSNYLVLFVGVIFANSAAVFRNCSCRLRWIIISWRSRRICWRKYQYMLSVPASVSSGNKLDGMISLLEYYMDTRTDNNDAEKFPPIP